MDGGSSSALVCGDPGAGEVDLQPLHAALRGDRNPGVRIDVATRRLGEWRRQ